MRRHTIIFEQYSLQYIYRRSLQISGLISYCKLGSVMAVSYMKLELKLLTARSITAVTKFADVTRRGTA